MNYLRTNELNNKIDGLEKRLKYLETQCLKEKSEIETKLKKCSLESENKLREEVKLVQNEIHSRMKLLKVEISTVNLRVISTTHEMYQNISK